MCVSSSNCYILLHLWMGPGILGNYNFSHTYVMVIDKVLSYDFHIVGLVLHNIPVVDIALGPPPLSNNAHDLVHDVHIFELKFFWYIIGDHVL